MTSSEAATLVELSRSRQCVLMTAYTRHFMASARHVQKHLASGVSPQAITAVQRKNIDDRGPFHGGILHARTVHIVDLIPWLTRRPIIGVSGRIEHGSEGYEALVDMHLDLKDGPNAHLLCISGDGEYQDEVTIYDRGQSFRLERERLYASDRRGLWSPVDDLAACGNSTNHFIDALQGKIDAADSPTALDGQDGLQALRVIEAIKEASRTGRFVAVPEN
jgi:predicted dehydrogenase